MFKLIDICCLLSIVLIERQVIKLQSAVKYGQEDFAGAKVIEEIIVVLIHEKSSYERMQAYIFLKCCICWNIFLMLSFNDHMR